MRDLALFAVTVMNQETRFHSRVIEPHAGITRLLHDPVASRIVSRGAAVDLSGTQMHNQESTRTVIQLSPKSRAVKASL